MRSYYSHLRSLGALPVKAASAPVLRSSALFPVWNNGSIKTRLLFMGYWFLKRTIHLITYQLVLRDHKGEALLRTELQQIIDAKSYIIELDELLSRLGFSLAEPFFGSLEISFHSCYNLVFAYPAVAVNYYGPQFSSVVHTAERTYNDFDDMHANSESCVAEGGFNIYGDELLRPFVAMINGPQEIAELLPFRLICYNSYGEVKEVDHLLSSKKPYEAWVVYLDELIDLKKHLRKEAGTIKFYCRLPWVFPRFISGNKVTKKGKSSAVVVTHSYYDCSRADQESDYWQEAHTGWYDAMLTIPLLIGEGKYTRVYFYPIYSPTRFTLDIEVYNSSGQRLALLPSVAAIEGGDQGSFTPLLLNELFSEKLTLLQRQEPLALRMLLRKEGSAKLPTRVKVAFDIGNEGAALPCNICTNFLVASMGVVAKGRTFKWAPFLCDKPGAEAWLINSSPDQGYHQEAHIDITFFREKDASKLNRKVVCAPHGFYLLKPDEELNEFFCGAIGWFTAISSNPYTTLYYFSRPEEGIVGGDHGF